MMYHRLGPERLRTPVTQPSIRNAAREIKPHLPGTGTRFGQSSRTGVPDLGNFIVRTDTCWWCVLVAGDLRRLHTEFRSPRSPMVPLLHHISLFIRRSCKCFSRPCIDPVSDYAPPLGIRPNRRKLSAQVSEQGKCGPRSHREEPYGDHIGIV